MKSGKRRSLLVLGILLAPWAPAAEMADNLGRLFFTRETRAALDAARLAAATPLLPLTAHEILQLPKVPEEVLTPPPPVTVNGIVTRSRGPATLWMNGAPQDARNVRVPGVPRETAPRVRVTRDAIEFALDAEHPAHRVKAGQTFDPARAEVREAHEAQNAEAP